MTAYFGGCHCGAVRFSFEVGPITSAMRCNCSMCRRKAGYLSAFTLTKDELRVETASDAVGLYQFGTHVAKHHFCTTCGVHPFTETRLKPGEFRINLGCVDDLDLGALEVTDYDGQSI